MKTYAAASASSVLGAATLTGGGTANIGAAGAERSSEVSRVAQARVCAVGILPVTKQEPTAENACRGYSLSLPRNMSRVALTQPLLLCRSTPRYNFSIGGPPFERKI